MHLQQRLWLLVSLVGNVRDQWSAAAQTVTQMFHLMKSINHYQQKGPTLKKKKTSHLLSLTKDRLSLFFTTVSFTSARFWTSSTQTSLMWHSWPAKDSKISSSGLGGRILIRLQQSLFLTMILTSLWETGPGTSRTATAGTGSWQDGQHIRTCLANKLNTCNVFKWPMGGGGGGLDQMAATCVFDSNFKLLPLLRMGHGMSRTATTGTSPWQDEQYIRTCLVNNYIISW